MALDVLQLVILIIQHSMGRNTILWDNVPIICLKLLVSQLKLKMLPAQEQFQRYIMNFIFYLLIIDHSPFIQF